MKKSILMLLLGSSLVYGADLYSTSTSSENKQYNLTLQFGVMHTESVDYYEPVDKASLLPTNLYGATIAAQWQVAALNDSSHHVGFSVGYYSGEEQFDISVLPLITINSDASLDVIPLLLTYNYEYHLNDRVSVYAGVRGGAVIRKTSFSNSTWDFGDVGKYDVTDSSTKVMPTLGVGVGAKVAISKSASFDIGYDFAWAFGESCGAMQTKSGESLNPIYYAKDHPYYGTVKVGFTFSF